MSDAGASAPPAVTGSTVQGAPLTAGAMLRNAREAAGLHIGALAVALKVPVRKLEALESDRLDLLPDVVFARALAASVCRTLKVDVGAVLDLLPGQVAPRLQPDVHARRALFDSPGSGWRLPLASRLSRPVVAAAGLLLAAALALLFVPGLDGSRKFSLGSKVPGVASGAPGAEAVPALLVAAPPPNPPDRRESPAVSAGAHLREPGVS